MPWFVDHNPLCLCVLLYIYILAPENKKKKKNKKARKKKTKYLHSLIIGTSWPALCARYTQLSKKKKSTHHLTRILELSALAPHFRMQHYGKAQVTRPVRVDGGDTRSSRLRQRPPRRIIGGYVHGTNVRHASSASGHCESGVCLCFLCSVVGPTFLRLPRVNCTLQRVTGATWRC